MPELLDEALAHRLKQAEADVVREFDSLDGDVVRSQFEQVTGDLLRDATVTDFVPVLAGRHVREILRSMPVTDHAGG